MSAELQIDEFNQDVRIDRQNGRLDPIGPSIKVQTGTLSASMRSYPTFPNPDRFVEARNNRYIL